MTSKIQLSLLLIQYDLQALALYGSFDIQGVFFGMSGHFPMQQPLSLVLSLLSLVIYLHVLKTDPQVYYG